jgi:hypothetical protein
MSTVFFPQKKTSTKRFLHQLRPSTPIASPTRTGATPRLTLISISFSAALAQLEFESILCCWGLEYFYSWPVLVDIVRIFVTSLPGLGSLCSIILAYSQWIYSSAISWNVPVLIDSPENVLQMTPPPVLTSRNPYSDRKDPHETYRIYWLWSLSDMYVNEFSSIMLFWNQKFFIRIIDNRWKL